MVLLAQEHIITIIDQHVGMNHGGLESRGKHVVLTGRGSRKEEEEGGNAAKQQLTQEDLAKFCADLQARLAQFSTLPSKVRD